MIFAILLAAVFIRPFISSQAFPYLNLVYSGLLLIFLWAYLIYKRFSFFRPQAWLPPILTLILALLVSVIFSQNEANSLAELYKYISGILLFLVAGSLSERDKALVIRTILLSGLIISILAIYQYFFGFGHVLNYLADNKFSSPFTLDYLRSKRVFLPFMTPGILGGYLAMIILLSLAGKNRRWFILPAILAMLFTKSLGAFLSLFCALGIYFGLKGKLKRTHIFGLLGLLIFIVIVFIWRCAGQREHLQPVFSTLMRLSYWKEALGIIKAHPLIGIGLGNFNLEMTRYAHNSYLQIWAEMGILGPASFIWLICAVFNSCFKNLIESLKKDQAAALLAACSVFLIHNFLDITFFIPEAALIWWVILGLITVKNNNKQ